MTDEKKTTRAPGVAYRYVGNGDNLSGIPARDLTVEDVAALSTDDKKSLTKSGLYEEGKHARSED